jgi:hypothetical protein
MGMPPRLNLPAYVVSKFAGATAGTGSNTEWGAMTAGQDKWYFKTYIYIIAFLCVGPFALPLAWLNPGYKARKKAAITAITLVLSYLIWVVFAKSLNSVMEYYRLILKELR